MDGEIDVFLLVLFGHWYFGTSGLEIDGDEFTEPVFSDGEGFLQYVCDIVLTGWRLGRESAQASDRGRKKNGQHPSQAPVEGLIYTLEVCDGNLFTEDHLVEAWDEEGIEETSVEDGHPDDASDELEVGEMLGIDVRRGVYLEGIAVHC